MKINNKIAISLVGLALVCIGLFYSQNFAIVSRQVIKLERVETVKAKQKGLSGRELLCDNCGMLFSYNKPQEIGIWMKDMNFSIDIVWLDKRKQIIHIEESVSPETYPRNFYDETGQSKYVIELPAGYVENKKLRQGDTFYFW